MSDPAASLTCDAGVLTQPVRPGSRPEAPEHAGLADLRAAEAVSDRWLRIGAAGIVTLVCGLISWHVLVKSRHLGGTGITSVYTILISSYVVSRFVLAACYRPPLNAGLEPSVAIVVPAYNEGEAVARTVHACLGQDYPADKLEIVVVDDGSTDDTWAHLTRAAACYAPGTVRCIDLGRNQGKRAAVAAGVRATGAEILIFVDSDSSPAPGAIRRLVQGFADERVGAVAGLTYVRNVTANALTRMQAARYFVSYQLLKAAESTLGAVTCCSGCFSAYRRSAIAALVEPWEHQRFLGAPCTHGDDRALTNQMLKRGWRAVYDCTAEAWTDAPTEYRKFFRQQLRWKKSWARESVILFGHLWRSRPAAFPFVAIATMSGLLSPLVLVVNLVLPASAGVFPTVYLLGLYLVAMAYALLYRAHRADGLWLWAFLGTFFYIAFSPQLWWAVARIRDGRWGTRELTTGAAPDPEPALESAAAGDDAVIVLPDPAVREGRRA